MSWDPKKIPEEFAEDPEFCALSGEEQKHLIAVMEKMLEMGIGAVYGEEDEGEADAEVDCKARLSECRSRCCTYHFALTKAEVEKGRIRHNPKRPFFIAREADGYCPHLDRRSLLCRVWADRPLRCRRYDCRRDE